MRDIFTSLGKIMTYKTIVTFYQLCLTFTLVLHIEDEANTK